MSRRAYSLPPHEMEKPERSRCTTAICFSWKILTCIFSHILLVTLVIAYCLAGASLFQYLEATNEKNVKQGIRTLRWNLTEDIWLMLDSFDYLEEGNWTLNIEKRLKSFEKSILKEMKSNGWDGSEDVDQPQWTFFGALFYSIIVITTIGYGHIAPKTDLGKVTTIFYAILGIPLMLLCLSNIGDIMATSFRFLYWRICCFVCTREPKRTSFRHLRQGRMLPRQPYRVPARFSSSIHRSKHASVRSADSGCVTTSEPVLMHAYSDPELRFPFAPDNKRMRHGIEKDRKREGRDRESSFNVDHDRNVRPIFNSAVRNPPDRFSNRDRYREKLQERHTVERERNIQLSNKEFNIAECNRTHSTRSMSSGKELRSNNAQSMTPISNRRKSQQRAPYLRSRSVDPRYILGEQLEDNPIGKIPVLCNKYALNDMERRVMLTGEPRRQSTSRSHSVPSQQKRDYLHPQGPLYINQKFSHTDLYDVGNEFCDDFKPPREKRMGSGFSHKRNRAVLPPSPRIMSPMGFAVHRQAKMTSDEDSFYDEEYGSYSELNSRNRPVPIWLCVFLVVSYIVAGAFLFSEWEGWSRLDAAYFCFITLTTIGFGDFVPAQKVQENSKTSIALCSLYLLFGISLLAMSFNLVQEEVIANVKSVAKRLGILKEEEPDD